MNTQKLQIWKKRILITLVATFAITSLATALPAMAADAPPPADAPTADETTATQPQPATSGSTSSGATEDRITSILQIQGAMNKLIWPVLVMIGGLMDNTLLFGNGMEERLREIWIPIRNIVNILFVIALVGVALYNVLGIGDENSNYSIKSILPKLVIGIIAVNFSFTGIKVFLDGINVLTTSIFSLPGQISTGLDTIVSPENDYDKEVIERFCRNIQGKTTSDFIKDDASLQAEVYAVITKNIAKREGVDIDPTDSLATIQTKINGHSKAKSINDTIATAKDGQICEGTKLSPQGEAFLSRYGSRNAALAMALGLSKMVFYNDIPPDANTIDKLAVNVIFSAILYLVYLASFLALFVVLLARMVVMWLSIAVAPILLLGISVPVVKEKIPGFDKLTDTFMKNALAPVGIALSMSVGWIMLKSINGINTPDANSTIILGGLGVPVVGLSTLQDVVVAAGVIGVVWLGVFAAAGESLAAPVTNFLKEGLQRVGKFAVTTPLRNIPVGFTKVGDQEVPVSVGGLSEVVNRLGAAGREKEIEMADAILGVSLPRLTDLRDRDKIQDAETALAFMKANDDAIKSGDVRAQRALKDMMDLNLPVFEQIRTRDPNLAKLIDDFTKEKDETKRREIGEKILENNTMRGIRAATGAATGKAATTGAAKEAIRVVNGETKFGNQEIKQIRPNDTFVATSQIDRGRNSIREQLSAASPDKNNIASSLNGMKLTDTNGQIIVPTKPELESLLGTADYKKMITTLGGEPALDQILTPATPPTTP